ncbi:MAG: NBR1-Ig-like domain-containing protein [Chloroflexota bacterium]
MTVKTFFLGLGLSLLLLLAACGGSDATPTPIIPEATEVPATATAVSSTDPVRSQATVDSIQVNLLESFPVGVNVVARGELPDGCTQLEEVVQQQSGNTFRVILTTLRDPAQVCTEALVPFEETIPLEVAGLKAGAYSVLVNGISGSFTLDADNVVAEEEPTPTAVPEAVAASISGRVWHDLCVGTLTAVAADSEAPAGCIAVETDTGTVFQANGLPEATEPGLPGVEVTLAEGDCANAATTTVVTDGSGNYSFADLPSGSYCVTIDPTSATNTAVLEEGIWSYLTDDSNAVALVVDEGEQVAGVDFGWDFQFLPAPEADLANCDNNVTFVSDLTTPDDTVIAPGAEFEVGWRLRNIGSCPWSTDYSAVYVDGDNLGVITATIPSAVAPGQTVDIFVTMTAPTTEGTYRSNWQLADADGNRFGVDGFLENAFWVQIVAGEPPAPGEPTPTPAPGSASIGGVAWRDLCSSSGTPAAICVETGGVFRGDGTYQGIERPLAGLTVTLAQGACPAVGTRPGNVLATALTGEDGTYVFDGLDSATYCIWVDAFSPANIELLIPGDFTWPATGVDRWTFILDPGEQEERIDFGWDDFDD